MWPVVLDPVSGASDWSHSVSSLTPSTARPLSCLVKGLRPARTHHCRDHSAASSTTKTSVSFFLSFKIANNVCWLFLKSCLVCKIFILFKKNKNFTFSFYTTLIFFAKLYITCDFLLDDCFCFNFYNWTYRVEGGGRGWEVEVCEWCGSCGRGRRERCLALYSVLKKKEFKQCLFRGALQPCAGYSGGNLKGVGTNLTL